MLLGVVVVLLLVGDAVGQRFGYSAGGGCPMRIVLPVMPPGCNHWVFADLPGAVVYPVWPPGAPLVLRCLP